MKSIKQRVKKFIPKWLFSRTVNYYHWLQAGYASLRNGHPARGLLAVGVTGTSGKSTTTAMIAHILQASGVKTAYFTTTGAFWGGEPHPNTSRMTTEDPEVIYRRLRLAREAGDTAVVIESSAHAAPQHRLDFVPYAGMVFTNLSHDHMDYFHTMENYQRAKKGLFKLAARHNGWGIVNANDPASDNIGEPIARHKLVRFGKGGDITATAIKESSRQTSFTVNYKGEHVKLTLPMIGRFNVDNALAAMAAAANCGISLADGARAMESFTGVVGRMEKIDMPNGATIVIDYAHTPKAFDLVLSELRRICKGKLIAVFGGYGEKDQTIRHPMGEIAAKYVDDIILTEDDPRSEKIKDINQDLLGGIRTTERGRSIPITEIDVREEAILEGLRRAGPHDLVACLGKGHERTIEYRPTPKPWNERQAVEDALAQLQAQIT